MGLKYISTPKHRHRDENGFFLRLVHGRRPMPGGDRAKAVALLYDATRLGPPVPKPD